MHSFHAFIDESGDEGFIFKEPPEKASSEWFILSATVVRDKLRVPVSNDLNAGIGAFEKSYRKVHFSKLNHEQRKYVAKELGALRVRLIHICINKKQLPPNHGLDIDRRLHRYAIRLLLERISWMCRDNAVQGEGDGRCKLNFAHCKNLSYEMVGKYLEKLKGTETQIYWASLDTAKINVDASENSIWLRTADIAASSIGKALELGPHGLCEDSYARLLRPVVYRYKEKCLAYGLKFLLDPPTVEKERDNSL